MNNQFKVYLAGPITGLTYGGAQDWRDYVSSRIDERIVCYSPLRGKDFFRGKGEIQSREEYTFNPLATDKGITTRDRFDCMGSDLIIFNLLGAKSVSIGTMIELGWADAARRPAIVVIEKEGNPHEHPMLRQTTHFRVEDLDSAVAMAEIILLNKRSTPDAVSHPEKIIVGGEGGRK